MLETVLYSLMRLFVVGGEHAMVMVVVAGGAHLYTKYHGNTQHYLLERLLNLRLFVLLWQHVTQLEI